MALLLFVLLTFLVLVMNVGHGYSVRSELQNAGDSAALAAVRAIGGNNLPALTTSLGTTPGGAQATAQTYAAAHKTDANNVTLLGGDVCFGTMLPGAAFQLLSCGGPPANPNDVYAINAVRVRAVRNAAHSGSGGALPIIGSGLLGSAPTINVVTSATAARFAPCRVASAAPLAFSLSSPELDTFLPCEATLIRPLGNIGVTLYTNSPSAAPSMANSVRSLLMNQVPTPTGPKWVCDPSFGGGQTLPTAPAQIYVQNRGAFAGGAATKLLTALACLASPAGTNPVDVGIIGDSVLSSGLKPVTTWARITVFNVNASANTITIRRECGASQSDVTAVAGRCRAVGLMSNRPVLVQ